MARSHGHSRPEGTGQPWLRAALVFQQQRWSGVSSEIKRGWLQGTRFAIVRLDYRYGKSDKSSDAHAEQVSAN